MERGEPSKSPAGTPARRARPSEKSGAPHHYGSRRSGFTVLLLFRAPEPLMRPRRSDNDYYAGARGRQFRASKVRAGGRNYRGIESKSGGAVFAPISDSIPRLFCDLRRGSGGVKVMTLFRIIRWRWTLVIGRYAGAFFLCAKRELAILLAFCNLVWGV